FPNRRRIVMVGLISGLFLALLVGLLIEWLDPRIRSVEEFQHLFELPVLGTIPKMKEGDLGDVIPSRIASDLPKSVAGESFRTLRTNVKFSHARNSGNTLLVTSSVPQEGKTTISSNLAATIALSGRRVVLVDADLRNPGISHAFELNHGPGLAHLLSGEITDYREALRETSVENLYVLPAGLIPPNPSELLDSVVLKEILDALSKDFDQVVIDSAPVLAVADTSIIASVARNVLLVFGMEKMNRTLIQRTIRQLEAAGAHLYGATLNRLTPEGQGYYYYAYTGAYSADAK
ncbi:MAG: polysaccharide biosynthesis tyrosine autokinase, partial [Chrysiogenetes bacterium]|nr:polysaccharide biosynthesis tyrosine autokinase [Chrysiogenetes bacterium]